MWGTVKDNWAQIVVMVFILGTVSAAYLEWRIKVNVDTAFTDAGLVNPADVTANTESIKDLEADQEKLDNKIERIVDILLED